MIEEITHKLTVNFIFILNFKKTHTILFQSLGTVETYIVVIMSADYKKNKCYLNGNSMFVCNGHVTLYGRLTRVSVHLAFGRVRVPDTVKTVVVCKMVI